MTKLIVLLELDCSIFYENNKTRHPFFFSKQPFIRHMVTIQSMTFSAFSCEDLWNLNVSNSGLWDFSQVSHTTFFCYNKLIIKGIVTYCVKLHICAMINNIFCQNNILMHSTVFFLTATESSKQWLKLCQYRLFYLCSVSSPHLPNSYKPVSLVTITKLAIWKRILSDHIDHLIHWCLNTVSIETGNSVYKMCVLLSTKKKTTTNFTDWFETLRYLFYMYWFWFVL